MGTGLLIGAALTIIIPEGVVTMMAADPHSMHTIGIFLLAGFALMLLVETFTPHPPHLHSHGESHPMLPKDPSEPSSPDPTSGLSATLGLVIHGAADGIALGASSLTGTAELGLIVFLAVLIHKGPAALGLTTTLLGLHLNHTQIKNRLLVFSLSAPLGAILTYALVSLFGTDHGASVDGKYGLSWWTGAVLLFSGGSFLYVATVIQPLNKSDCHTEREEISRPMSRAFLLVTGMLIPLGLALLVGDHDH